MSLVNTLGTPCSREGCGHALYGHGTETTPGGPCEECDCLSFVPPPQPTGKPPADAPAFPRDLELVCAGERCGEDRRRYYLWFELAGGLPKRRLCFTPKRGSPFAGRPGVVHAARETAEGAFEIGRFLRRHADERACAQWEAERVAAATELQLATRLREAEEADHIWELLAPLRLAYARSAPVARHAIVARAIRAITGRD